MKATKLYEIVTPVLMQIEEEQWVHPDIESILEWEVDVFNPGKWAYDGLTRVYIKNDEGKAAHLVVFSKDLKEGLVPLDELKAQLEVTLFEDVWSPGGEQFCFTPFGKMMSKALRCNIAEISFASPDVGIEDDSGEYSWSS